MMKYFLLLIFSFLFSIVHGQELHRCLTDSIMQKVFEENPEYKKNMEVGFRQLHVLRSKQKNLRRDEEIVIPVHFIIVHPPGQEIGEGENHSIARILSQLDVINQDFARTNTDAHLTPSVFPVGDTGIRFCLAAFDPNGQPTTGITRYATDLNFRQNELMIKTATGWPREDYLNIWVAELGEWLGFAYIPTTSNLPNRNLDGVMIRHNVFGGPGYGQPPRFNKGRTGTHEIGHYLGLRHVWAGGCTGDDGIDDTPIQEKENFHCPTHPSPSCTNAGDMFMNYMDYVDDSCMNAFTIGQGDYMHLILNTVRSSIGESAEFRCIEELPLELIINDLNPINCHDDEAAIVSLKAHGGRAPYRFFLGNQSNTDGLFADLEAGEYSFVVEDVLERRDTLKLTIIRPDALGLDIVNIEHNLCFGGSDGSVVLAGNGGKGSYDFSLEGPLFSNNSSGLFSNLLSGEYTAVLVDSAWCETRMQFVIESPAELEVNTPLKTDPNCFGSSDGQLLIAVSGGVPPYQFTFNGNTTPVNVFNEIAAGIYTLKIEDANECKETRFIEFSEPDEIIPSITREVKPGCNGPLDGVLELTASGGIPPYQYSLDGVHFQADFVFDALTEGDYTIFVRDSRQCEQEIFHVLAAKKIPDYSVILGSDIACHGDSTGFIEINIMDVDGSYTIELNGVQSEQGLFEGLTSGVHALKIKDADGCYIEEFFILTDDSPIEFELSEVKEPRCHDSSDGTFSIVSGISGLNYIVNGQAYGNQTEFTDLPGGHYLVIAVDGGDCPASRSLVLNTPRALQIDWNLTEISCHSVDDAELRLRATGGNTGELLWRFDDGDFVMAERQIVLQNLSSGIYRIQLQDPNLCEAELEVIIENPTPIITGYTLLSPDDCSSDEFTGSFSIFAFGGTPPYIYKILGLETDLGLFYGFQGGIYQMELLDSRDCIVGLEIKIPMENGFNIESMLIEDVSCFGLADGRMALQISPDADYIFRLIQPEQLEVEPDRLPAGEYVFSVSESDFTCPQLLSFTVIEPEPLSLKVIDIEYLSGVDLYRVAVEAAGGTLPYKYSLNAAGPFTDMPFLEIEQAGNYQIFVEDANSCVYMLDFQISSTYNPASLDSFLVYPNPARDILRIKGGKMKEKETRIMISDVTGRKISQLHQIVTGQNGVTELDIHLLEDGIYFLHIITSGNIKSTKFVKLSK
jgi:hypothetical protein